MANQNDRLTGGCQCGRVRYSVAVEDTAAYLCHCRMCQRATGGVSIAFTSVRTGAIEWRHPPDWFRSSPIAHRPFCATCGTPLGFAYLDSDRMDLTIGSFDDPSGFRPTDHSGAESLHEAWIDTRDLPRTRTDEDAKISNRWIEACGKLPD